MSEVNQNEPREITLSGMYQNYFLDYASYVILERAVPTVFDGLKPVQRRILYSLKEKDDGRYHKVANVIGHTMQYHPHGDAAIGDALVNLGQKELLIDCQGNWGDTRTGDRAAAPRYIEARLTKFALEVLFNGDTTEWQATYDGRNKEPIRLPVKFPLVLSQGVDGIAVGLSTKILPHNFIELIKASIKILQDKPFKLYPDFLTGGMLDASDYNKGKRGGKVKVRSVIKPVDKNHVAITEIPYGTTTTSLIDSIVKANDQGKIKIKKVTDNTAKDVEILVTLAPGVSPEVTIDALYAFTNCEVSISPNACVIIDDKPVFLGVDEMLKISTEHTKGLLKQELEIKLADLSEKWHFASLEKIFIENRIYRDIEEAENWEQVLERIEAGLKKYVATPSTVASEVGSKLQLLREITIDDITRLTEIKIKRISKYNTFAAEEKITTLEKDIAQVKHDLAHLVEFAVAYFERLLEKYGKGKERKTEITTFEEIKRTQVIANNCKLYVNRKDGFLGFGLKKEEFVKECSDIDDVIVFKKDGSYKVVRISDKTFVGKDIVHIDIWRKGDERTTYNAIYLDGKTGNSYVKRFNVKAITREKDYFVTQGNERSKMLYFEIHPNGEAEVVNVQLTQASTARKKMFDFDFASIDIKGRGSKGNTLSKYPVKKVSLKAVGKSTLGAQKIWYDETVSRINKNKRGQLLGEFDTGDYILVVYSDGSYEVTDFDVMNKYDGKALKLITKLTEGLVVNVVHYAGEKKAAYVKRFNIEKLSTGQRYSFITEDSSSKMLFVTTNSLGEVSYRYKRDGSIREEVLKLEDFVSVKGWKAIGNKLVDSVPNSFVQEVAVLPVQEVEFPKTEQTDSGDAPQKGLFD